MPSRSSAHDEMRHGELRMQVGPITKRFALAAAMALACAGESAAQVYQPESFQGFDRFDSMPGLMLGVSPSAVRALEDEHRQDLRALDAFRGGKRAIDRFSDQVLQQPKPWTLYGRLGVLNFQNALEPGERESGTKFSLRSTGPRLRGKIYIGIHRQF